MKYCRHCALPLQEGAQACSRCGCPVTMGNQFCSECGTPRVPDSVYCVECGTPIAPQTVPQRSHPARSRWAAAAFGIVTGCFGIHSFYLGFFAKGLFQIVITLAAWLLVMLGVIPSFGGLLLGGLWGFIEGVLIAVGETKTDAYGKPLQTEKKGM